MIRTQEATGKTVDEARANACAKLGVQADDINVSYEVLEMPQKTGFLGLKLTPAKVRVTVEEADPVPAAPVVEEKAAPAPVAEEPKAEEKTPVEEAPAAPAAEEAPAAQPVEEAAEAAPAEDEEVEVPIHIEENSRSAGPHGAYGVVEAVKGSQEYNVGFRHGFVDDGCRIKAVHHRHFNVHQHQLRLNLTGAFNRLPSVRNALDEGIRAKQITHLSAQILQAQRFVLRDQYL